MHWRTYEERKKERSNREVAARTRAVPHTDAYGQVMPYHDTLSETRYDLKRDTAFSYRCNGCKNCCHDKAIRVIRHEILRLARRLGASTIQFIADYTEAGGRSFARAATTVRA
jgi:hypothetical protein